MFLFCSLSTELYFNYLLAYAKKRNYKAEFDIVIEQNGVCYHSQVPLRFSKEHLLSLERLDPALNYTKNSTVDRKLRIGPKKEDDRGKNAFSECVFKQIFF